MNTHCLFCRTTCNDSVRYGNFLEYSDLNIHRNCLCLGFGLSKEISTSGTIDAISLKSIWKLLERCGQMRCTYCNRKGALIKCCGENCNLYFHLPCGLAAGALLQFNDDFASFCNEHYPNICPPPPKGASCSMCFDILDGVEIFNITWSPCCKNGWYHKYCVQKYAHHAGIYFKCPLCNNEQIFRTLKMHGIFVPNTMASWEREYHTDGGYFTQFSLCTAILCVNRQGREGDYSNLIFCQLCGSNPQHVVCLRVLSERYICAVCSIAVRSMMNQSNGNPGVSSSGSARIRNTSVNNGIDHNNVTVASSYIPLPGLPRAPANMSASGSAVVPGNNTTTSDINFRALPGLPPARANMGASGPVVVVNNNTGQRNVDSAFTVSNVDGAQNGSHAMQPRSPLHPSNEEYPDNVASFLFKIREYDREMNIFEFDSNSLNISSNNSLNIIKRSRKRRQQQTLKEDIKKTGDDKQNDTIAYRVHSRRAALVATAPPTTAAATTTVAATTTATGTSQQIFSRNIVPVNLNTPGIESHSSNYDLGDNNESDNLNAAVTSRNRKRKSRKKCTQNHDNEPKDRKSQNNGNTNETRSSKGATRIRAINDN